MSQALYRRYRSKSLDEIVGQQHVTSVLLQSLKQDKITHAYLLTGPRGVGKTSIARILAHEISKLPYDGTNHLDIIEIDAASNNGVDDIRDLREKVSLAPISAKKKIYIIDEVHMLSKAAFNALLKTLEEPPEHVVFILATTEVHKLPDTILSRTQRFHFKTIDKTAMTAHLRDIASKEKIDIEDDALELIADRAQGSFRDAISLLDQLQNSSQKKITLDDITTSLGLAGHEAVEALSEAILRAQPDTAIGTLAQLEDEGVSSVVIADQLCRRLRQEVIQHPQIITVIEKLIDVGRSFDPQLKLFAVVLEASQPTEKGASSPKVISLTAPQPSITIPAPPPPKKAHKPEHDIKAPQNITLDEDTPSASDTTDPATGTTIAPTEIIWNDVLEHVREHYLAIYGVLQKADAQYEHRTLRLNFPYALHKKKLDDTKYRQMLSASIVSLYGSCPNIETTSGKLPPKNSKAKQVAAIMGGGEEISVE